MPRWGYYVLSFTTTAATAVAGSVASAQSPSFYQELERPSWAPPAIVFAPVWTALYIMIAISAGMALSASPSAHRVRIAALLSIQFVLNGLWTWIFFVWRNGALALADIVGLWISIAILIMVFWRIRKIPAVLLIPYFAWVSYATALTFAVWRANPELS